MTQLKKRIRENGINYTLVGDYYIPELVLHEENRPIGKYGRMHKEYMKSYHNGIFEGIVLTGRMWTYLADIEEQAQARLECIIEQMREQEGVTEQLKESDQMLWVQMSNNIKNRAEEIVLKELIYTYE